VPKKWRLRDRIDPVYRTRPSNSARRLVSCCAKLQNALAASGRRSVVFGVEGFGTLSKLGEPPPHRGLPRLPVCERRRTILAEPTSQPAIRSIGALA
jgi:hypothetical protein